METSSDRLLNLFKTVEKLESNMLEPLFDRHGVDREEGLEELVNEIRLDGSNTIASVFRGWKGVEYDQIVRAVANQLKVDPINPDENEIEMEQRILESIFDKVWNMHEKEVRRALEKEKIDFDTLILEKDHGTAPGARRKALAAGAITGGAVLGLLAKQLGGKVTAGIIKDVALQLMGNQATKAVLLRGIPTLGWMFPIVNVALMGWVVADVSGPAFRKTIPTVNDIALLRLEYSQAEETKVS